MGLINHNSQNMYTHTKTTPHYLIRS